MTRHGQATAMPLTLSTIVDEAEVACSRVYIEHQLLEASGFAN